MDLRNTDTFKKLIEEKRAIELQEPNLKGVFIVENGKHVNGPNHEKWRIARDEWINSYKSWFNAMDDEYKLCFKACYEKMMMLDGEYISKDYQFPGFIMYKNISGLVKTTQ
jgi:hypothetical protein